MAALCGVLAGALGLGLAELIAGLVPGAPSPVLSIGALLISLQPPNAKQFVVDLFGTNDKAVLSVAVVIGALVLSAGIGLLARRSLLAGRIAFGALGLFALLAAGVAARQRSTEVTRMVQGDRVQPLLIALGGLFAVLAVAQIVSGGGTARLVMMAAGGAGP